MRLPKSGGFIARLWILCIIGTVFAGICFDTMQTDSCLAYQNAGNAAATDGAGGGLGDDTAVSPALRGTRRGIPAGQAYVSEISQQGGCALVPRKTAQRTISRNLFGGTLLLFGGIFLSAFFSGRITLFRDGLREVISNTVILRYIHVQDGEKA